MGVPCGVKDIIETCDMPTEYGSPIYRGHRPRRDAACVALSRRAGAVLMGKTVTTEFVNRHPGKTRNPFDTDRTPGGTSSGSAAAVGDCMVPLALGTQTTGSTIRPASFCGAIGYRPTFGELSCSGIFDSARSLDTVGLFARSVEDIALFRDVLLGAEPVPITPLSQPPRIGFCRTPWWSQIEPYTRKLLEDAAAELTRHGATVEEVDLPSELSDIEEAQRLVTSFEFARSMTWEVENHWEDISEALRTRKLKDGLACTLAQYREACSVHEHCRGLFTPLMRRYDVLLAAAAAGEAPIGWDPVSHNAVYQIWTAMRVPLISLPVFKGPNGLPIGVQLIANRRDDCRLFAVSRWIVDRLGH